jgi:hypothetical protein
MGSGLSVRSLSKVASALTVMGAAYQTMRGFSVLDCFSFGSSVSLRGVLCAGSGFSVISKGVLHKQMSVYENANLGSSVSMRSFARCGSSASVLRFLQVGSSMSLRSMLRMVQGLSALHGVQLGMATQGGTESHSVMDYCHVGSSLSLRRFSRCGSDLSLLSFMSVNSSLSTRSFMRQGSGRRACLSVLSFISVGSSLSMRRFQRLGSSLSVGDGRARSYHTGVIRETLSIQDSAALGSALSVRCARHGHEYVHGRLSVGRLLALLAPSTSLRRRRVSVRRRQRRVLHLASLYESLRLLPFARGHNAHR